MKKFICRNCGSVNETSEEALHEMGDWLDCTLPRGFEWTLPAGKITPIIGDPIYISGYGEHLSRDAYLQKYSLDPEIAYSLMRGRAHSRAASGYATRQSPPAAREFSEEPHARPLTSSKPSSKSRSRGWIDDDDWTF